MTKKHKCDDNGGTSTIEVRSKSKVVVYLVTYCSVCGVETARDVLRTIWL